MNIADFLQLQASLQRNGIVQTASDKEYILGIGKFCRKPLDSLLILQNLCNLLRKLLDCLDQLSGSFLGNLTLGLAQSNGQNINCDQLGRICLCGCNGDLRSCIGIHDMVCLSGDGRTDDIYNTNRCQSHILRHTKGC